MYPPSSPQGPPFPPPQYPPPQGQAYPQPPPQYGSPQPQGQYSPPPTPPQYQGPSPQSQYAPSPAPGYPNISSQGQFAPPPSTPQYGYQTQQPPQRPASGRKYMLLLGAVVSVVIIVILAWALMTPAPRQESPQTFSLRADATPDGYWSIDILAGSAPAGDITLQVLDPTTGTLVVSGRVNMLSYEDAEFDDANQNGKLDAGDSIILKYTGDVDSGMAVRLLKGTTVLGTVAELPGMVLTNLGLRVERTTAGDWLISITSGSKAASGVTFKVLNPSTGAVVSTTLASPGSYNFIITPASNWGATPAGVWNNNNGNSWVDAGDTFVLYTLDPGHANGKDLAGMKVMFLVGESIIGMIKELPA